MKILPSTLNNGEKLHRLYAYRLRVKTKEITKLLDKIRLNIDNNKLVPRYNQYQILKTTIYTVVLDGRWVIISLNKNPPYYREWKYRIMFDDFHKPGQIDPESIATSLIPYENYTKQNVK